MAVEASDWQLLESTNRLGGAITANQITSNQLENLFNNIPSAKATPGATKYACFYVKNNHGSESVSAVLLYILSNTTSADTAVEIGLGTAGVSSSEQAIANDETAPVGVVFSSAADQANALNLPDLAAGAYKAVWVKYVVNANAAAANDSYSTRLAWDTGA